MHELVDNRLNIETPEGVEFHRTPAGPLARLMAASIDLGIRIVVYIALSTTLFTFGNVGTGLLLIAMFCIEWGYPIAFEMYASGATPGKKAMNLQVLHTDGTPVGWHASIIRNLLRIADFLPLGYAFGIVSMAATSHFQRLGDLAAGTVVCYAENTRSTAQAQARALQIPRVEPVLIAETLTSEEQAAIVSFAERSRFLGPERSQEVAAIIEPLSGTDSGKENLSFLYGLANRIVR